MVGIICCCKAGEVPGIKVFRFSSSLYYANASHFVQQLYKRTNCNPEHINEQRAQQKQRQTELARKHKKVESVALKRKKHLQFTADREDRMFTVMCWLCVWLVHCWLQSVLVPNSTFHTVYWVMVKTSSLSKRVTYPHRFFLWLVTAMDCTALKANSQSNGNWEWPNFNPPGSKTPEQISMKFGI